MAKHRWDPRCDFPRVVTPVRVDPSGAKGPTKAQAAGPNWRRASKGLYVPSGTDSDLPEQRIIEVAQRLPRNGAVTGWAACRWAGANFLDGLASDGVTFLPVPLIVGSHGQMARTTDAVLSYEALRGWESWMRRGIRVTRPEKAVYDEMRRQGDVREATVVLEAVLAARLTSLRRVRTYVEAHRRDRRNAIARDALDLASEHSISPQEVRLRLIAELDAGLPRLLVNCPIHSLEGRLLGVADLLDLEAGLVLEFDGADHRSARRHTADLRKDEAFRSRGLEVTRVSGTDLRRRDLVVRRIRAARARARFQPMSDRLWVPRPAPDRLDQELDQHDQRSMIQQWLYERHRPDAMTG